MLKKIISGGQTGADRAALDAAMEMGITHGGWVPRGRKAEDGRVDQKYQMQEMKSSSYKARTEQNVIDSDGTLIISHGKLTGGSALTLKLAKGHERPCLHIDLESMNPYSALKAVNYWLCRHEIEILNVAGPRQSKDPGIYEAVRVFVKNLIHLNCLDSGSGGNEAFSPLLPATVNEAVDDLMSRLRPQQKKDLGQMEERDLIYLNATLGQYVRVRYGLWSKANPSLLCSCEAQSGKEDVNAEEASFIIVRSLWEQLRSGRGCDWKTR